MSKDEIDLAKFYEDESDEEQFLTEGWDKEERETEEPLKRFKNVAEEIRSELKEIKGAGELGRGMKLPVVLSREECQKLITAFIKGKFAFRNNLISRILYSTGMRVEELEQLRFCDINYETQTVFIRSGKGDKDRYTCADEETLKLLKKWQEGKKLENPVIGLTVRQLRRIVEKAGELTGVPEKYKGMDRVFSTHSLRHAFATHSYENGMRTLTLKKLLGHEYLGTTQIYVYTAMKYDVMEYVRTNPFVARDTTKATKEYKKGIGDRTFIRKDTDNIA